ncbi:hypothetical protein ILP74_13935 [Citrobacter amalonaticus]|nr:hypothetical protein [Citrobacter amalonaticus]MBE0396519.1 hypothetical protein [Citrobacter amalonaticus]
METFCYMKFPFRHH